MVIQYWIVNIVFNKRKLLQNLLLTFCTVDDDIHKIHNFILTVFRNCSTSVHLYFLRKCTTSFYSLLLPPSQLFFFF